MDDLDLHPLSINDMQKALLSGDLDACSLWQPFGMNILLASGYERVPLNTIPNDDIMELYVALAANSKFLNKRPEEAYNVMRAMDAAKGFAHENPEDAINIIAKFIDVPTPLLAEIYQDIHFRMEPIPDAFWDQVRLQSQWIANKPRIDIEKIVNILKY